MYASTLKLLQTILDTDTSLNKVERDMLAVVVTGGEAPSENVPNQIISRKEARDRYFPNRSLRFIDRLSEAGALKRIVFAGRKRASGFRPQDIEALINNYKESH